MTTIHKATLDVVREQTVQVPDGVHFLAVQDQDGKLCAWYVCDPTMHKTQRRIIILGTGHDFPNGDHDYIATVQQGEFVWHIFEAVS